MKTGGLAIKIGPVKMDKWPCCTQQMHQTRQIIAVGQETMALAIGNRKWWCGKSNNVFAGWGMVVLKPMMKPAKSNHGGAGIDKCTSQMKRSGAAGKKCGSKTRHGYVAISISAGLMRQYAFDLTTFEQSFWISLILLHGNSHGGDQIFKMTDKEKRVCLLASGHSNSRFIPKQMNSHFSFCRVTALSSLTSALYMDVQMKGINQHQILS
jgi:hypothetical protein